MTAEITLLFSPPKMWFFLSTCAVLHPLEVYHLSTGKKKKHNTLFHSLSAKPQQLGGLASFSQKHSLKLSSLDNI